MRKHTARFVLCFCLWWKVLSDLCFSAHKTHEAMHVKSIQPKHKSQCQLQRNLINIKLCMTAHTWCMMILVSCFGFIPNELFNFWFRFGYRWIHLDQVDPENQISKNESNVTERYDILYECDIWCTMRILMLLHLSLAWVSKRTVSSMDGIAYAVPAMQNAESRWPALGNDAIPGRAQEPGLHVAIVPWIRCGGVVNWTNDTPARNAWSWVLFWVVITITCVALMFIIMLMILRGHHTTNGPARLTPYFTIVWNEILAKSSTVQSMNGGVSNIGFPHFCWMYVLVTCCVDWKTHFNCYWPFLTDVV